MLLRNIDPEIVIRTPTIYDH